MCEFELVTILKHNIDSKKTKKLCLYSGLSFIEN